MHETIYLILEFIKFFFTNFWPYLGMMLFILLLKNEHKGMLAKLKEAIGKIVVNYRNRKPNAD